MGGSSKTSPPVLTVSFVCGLCLGVGVAFGGMTDGRKTSSFFNITNLGTEFWDPRYCCAAFTLILACSHVHVWCVAS